MALEKGETTPLVAVFGLTAHPSDDRDGDGAVYTRILCSYATECDGRNQVEFGARQRMFPW